MTRKLLQPEILVDVLYCSLSKVGSTLLGEQILSVKSLPSGKGAK